MDVRIIELNEADLPDHEELAGSPRADITQDSLSIIRRLKCLWTVAPLLASELIGRFVQHSPTVMNFYVGHKMPWANIDGEDVQIIAEEVSIEPFGIESQGVLPTRGVYDHAILNVIYRVCPTVDIDILTDEIIRPSAEFLTQAPDGFSWTADGSEALVIDEAPGIIVKMLEWDYEIKWFPLIFVGEILARNGQINDATITSYKFNMSFGPKTLLCLAPDVDPQPTMINEGRGTVTLHFAYRPTGWNNFYKHGTKIPTPIYEDGAEVEVYSTVDLSGLFLNEV